jgi:hypothetical protein
MPKIILEKYLPLSMILKQLDVVGSSKFESIDRYPA